MSPEELFMRNIKLAYAVSKKYTTFAANRGVYKEDLEQEALLSLWTECQKYVKSKGALSTVIWLNTKRDLRRFLNDKQNFLVPVVLNEKGDAGERRRQDACMLPSEELPAWEQRVKICLDSAAVCSQIMSRIEKHEHGALMLKWLEGYSAGELGKLYATSTQTVLNRINKVRRDLCIV